MSKIMRLSYLFAAIYLALPFKADAFVHHQRQQASALSRHHSYRELGRLNQLIHTRRPAGRKSSKKQDLRMLDGGDDITIIVEQLGENRYYCSATYASPRGTTRVWRFRTSYEDLERLHGGLERERGPGFLPPPPPRSLAAPDIIESYLQKLLAIHQVVSSSYFFEFADIPPDLVSEPVLVPEVVGDDDYVNARRQRRPGAVPIDQEDEEDVAMGAGVAGAVAGGLLLGGLPGLLLGAAAATAAARNGEGKVGEIARAAGTKALGAIEAARAADKTYEVSKSIKSVLKKGAEKLKDFADELDEPVKSENNNSYNDNSRQSRDGYYYQGDDRRNPSREDEEYNRYYRRGNNENNYRR